MIDLVYPIGHSLWSHNELRYSLRSVHLYAKREVRNVFIVGNCPAWLKGVIHVPVRVGGGTVTGQLRAFREVIQNPKLGRLFAYMNDDIYLLSKPPWYDQFHLERSPTRVAYFKRCYDRAVEYLADRGIGPAVDYELHTPMLFEREALRDLLDTLPADTSLRTVYGNLYPDPDRQPMADVKLRAKQLPGDDWWCFSTDDVIVRTPAFQQWIAERYPEKSRWEV